METEVKEEVKLNTQNGDHDRFRHYVNKRTWAEGLLTGNPVTALCGKVFLPETMNEKYPVCPECKEQYGMPIFRDDPK
jgi:hypothetical protein